VIGRDGGGVEARKLEAAMAIGGAHHRDLDALAVDSGDAAGPFALDWHAALKDKAKLAEELNGGIEVFHHDADVVHTLDCHDVSSASNDSWSSAAENSPRITQLFARAVTARSVGCSDELGRAATAVTLRRRSTKDELTLNGTELWELANRTSAE